MGSAVEIVTIGCATSMPRDWWSWFDQQSAHKVPQLRRKGFEYAYGAADKVLARSQTIAAHWCAQCDCSRCQMQQIFGTDFLCSMVRRNRLCPGWQTFQTPEMAGGRPGAPTALVRLRCCQAHTWEGYERPTGQSFMCHEVRDCNARSKLAVLHGEPYRTVLTGPRQYEEHCEIKPETELALNAWVAV